jgi:MFS transporter, DHA1 family, multidrug resistance protein
MVTPLLALYLHVVLRERSTRIGFVLTVLIATQQVLPAVTGPLADRFGLRRVLVAGLVARSLGYGAFAWGGRLPLLLAAAAFAGAGGAAFTPAAKAMVALAAGERRLEAFALRSVAVNAGAALGPLVGGLLFGHFRVVFVVAICTYAVFLLAVLRRIPADRPKEVERAVPALGLVRDRALLWLTVVSAGFWFLYTQFTFTFPLYAADRFHVTGRVGLLFTLNAALVLALQYAVVARLTPPLGSWRLLALGMAVAAASFAVLAGLPSRGALVAFTVVFTLGELMVVPTLDTLASLLAPAASMAAYLGVASLGWALGGVAGNLAGGALYATVHTRGDYWALWLGDAGLALLTAAGFLALRSRYSARAS